MKKIFAALLALVASTAFGATLNPVQLLNPAGSTAGQTVVSTGASSAPGWATVPLSGLSSIAANTVLANATGSSAAPAAFAMPGCSTANSVLQWTTNTGFTCYASGAILTANTFTGVQAVTNTTAATSATTGAITDAGGLGVSGQIWTGSGGGFEANWPSYVTTNTLPAGIPPGSVGQGPLYTQIVRTGGYGQYGNWLNTYTITAATPVGQIDNGITTWVTHENLTGGAVFGFWGGANTPSLNLGEMYTGGAALGGEINVGNRWGNFGLQQNAHGATRWTVGLQSVPDVLPATDGLNTANVTCTATSPGVCTLNSNGFYNNMGVVFGGTTVPGGLTAGTTYYVQNVATNTFQVSATIGGASINFSSTGTAVNVLPSWPGNFAWAAMPSIHGHQWWVSDHIETDTLVPGGVGHLDYGGSASSDAPASWAEIHGTWGTGLSCVNGTFTTTYCIELGNLQAMQIGSAGGFYGNSNTMVMAAPVTLSNGYTVGTLPSGQVGARAYVTDATSCTFMGTLTGGGSTKCPVFYNGSSWVGG